MPIVHHVSDTALWAAIHRAKETERPDAQFRDPYAKRLAGERGKRIAAAISFPEADSWSWMARTYLIDHFITDQVQAGADMVLNLGAGLDTRPYRMMLPGSLIWVEVDLPSILDYKEEVLAADAPHCKLERIRLDLADVAARRALFQLLGTWATNVIVISEGVIIYLTAADTAMLAEDLAAIPTFGHWVLDIVSPGLLRMLRERTQQQFSENAAPMQFAPENGPEFFSAHGWKSVDVQSLLKTAARLGRVPEAMRPFVDMPEDPVRMGQKPWAGVCLLARSS